MNGSVGAGQLPPINVGMSFSDILENLDAGLMGAFEARKGAGECCSMRST